MPSDSGYKNSRNVLIGFRLLSLSALSPSSRMRHTINTSTPISGNTAALMAAVSCARGCIGCAAIWAPNMVAKPSVPQGIMFMLSNASSSARRGVKRRRNTGTLKNSDTPKPVIDSMVGAMPSAMMAAIFVRVNCMPAMRAPI